MIQPAPYSVMRRKVAAALPPISSGGPPALAGVGPIGPAKPRGCCAETARGSASWASKVRPRSWNEVPVAS